MKPNYQIDLCAQQAEYESNYWRLLKLLPDLENCDCLDLGLALPGIAQATIRAQVLERSRYTTTLALGPAEQHSVSWLLPYFCIQLYHDVQMAEVIRCERQRRIEPRQPYPNPRMHAPDELWQWNRHLGEWLRYALDHGYAVQVPLGIA